MISPAAKERLYALTRDTETFDALKEYFKDFMDRELRDERNAVKGADLNKAIEHEARAELCEAILLCMESEVTPKRR